jgi:hypothetical protein
MAITKKVAQLASQLNLIGRSADWQMKSDWHIGRSVDWQIDFNWLIGRLFIYF